jgi:hypothetical protein
MLGTLVIALSAAVAVLALLDFFLSKAQKEWLSNAVIRMWSILDEARGWSFSDWVKQPRARWWLALSLGIFPTLLISQSEFLINRFVDKSTATPKLNWIDIVAHITAFMIAVPLLFLLAWSLLAWLLQRRKLNLAVILLAASVGYLVVVVFMMLIHGYFTGEGFGPVRHPVLIWVQTLAALPFLLAFLCALLVLLSIGVAYVASATLYVAEFVVRRIAEYPKGPVLALSALLGGVAALIKAFGAD